MNVENDPLFKKLCHDRSLSENSVKRYKLVLQKYVDFTEMSLEDLLGEAESEEDTIPRLRKRKINEHLSDFKDHLTQEGNSNYYINHQMSLVRSFYYEFDIQLPRSRRRKTRKDKKQETIEDLPTIADIRKSLDHSNTTYRAIILLMLSSGMSRSEIPSLTFKHLYDGIPLEKYPQTLEKLIEEVENKKNLIIYWKIERVKTGKPYFTFNSPETSDLILEYLKELHRSCPDYNPKPEDTLFRPYNIPITPDSVSQMFKRINKRAGLRRSDGSLTIRPHALRKFFASTLERNKFPHLYTRWLMGHSVDKTTDAYFKADPGAVKEEYILIVDQLSVNEEIESRTVTSEGYDDLLEKLKQKDNEIFQQQEEINEIKSKLTGLDGFAKLMEDPKVRKTLQNLLE